MPPGPSGSSAVWGAAVTKPSSERLMSKTVLLMIPPGSRDHRPAAHPVVVPPAGRSELDALAETAAGLVRDEWLLAADLELLDGPRVAVRVGEAEERATVARVDDLDVGALDAPADELGSSRGGVGHDELDAVEGSGRHRLLRREVADDDRAPGAPRRQLGDVHVLVLSVVVEVEADLVAVEGDRGPEVADR